MRPHRITRQVTNGRELLLGLDADSRQRLLDRDLPTAKPTAAKSLPQPSTSTTFRCANCEDRGRSPVAFRVTTVPGAISEHWCGMKVRWVGGESRTHWTGGDGRMQVVHDPGDARGLVLLALLAAPTALALIAVGIGAAILVAIGSVIALLVWRVFLRPGAMFLSDIVDNVRGVPPDEFASRRGKSW